MNAYEVKAYKCEVCKKAYMGKDDADKCCVPKPCEDCGKELPLNYYYTVCDLCRESRKYNKAVKMTLEEYQNQYVMINDRLIDIIDEIEDWDEEFERPAYGYGVEECFVKLNADGIIDNLNDQVSFEDEIEMFSEAAKTEICEFCEKWNARNAYQYYEENPKILVLIPQTQNERGGKPE